MDATTADAVESPPDDKVSTYDLDREKTVSLARAILDFFAGLCLPEVIKFGFPPIFLAIWDLMVAAASESKGKLQLAIGLPRGFAKTMFLKLFIVYCILFTDRKFFLIVCNTEQLALNFVADIIFILDSPNIKFLFGNWRNAVERDTLALKKFTFRTRTIIIAGIGVGTSMRGLNIKFERPDVILMDDMQSLEDSESPEIAKKQLVWLMGTLMKARNYKRCLFIFLGNMYPHEGCILRRLKHSTQWTSFICGGILADGKSLWEDLRPLNDLLAELENDIELGHPEIFYCEVLNDEEAGTVSGIDTSKIPPYPTELDGVEPQAGFIIIDPATKKNKITNETAIGAFLIYDGIPIFKELKAGMYSPIETIRNTLEMALRLGIKLIAVESNAYQYTLLYWFDFIRQQIGIGTDMRFVELYAGLLSKNSKIKGVLPKLLRKSDKQTAEILLHPSVRSKVVTQITQWNPLKTKNVDDVLDLLAWVDKCIELYGNEMELQGSINLSIDVSPPAAFAEDLQLAF